MFRLFVVALVITAFLTGILFLLGQAVQKQAGDLRREKPDVSSQQREQADDQTASSSGNEVTISVQQIQESGTEREASLVDEDGSDVGSVDVESTGDELRIVVEAPPASQGAAVTAGAGSCEDRRQGANLPGVSESATVLDLKPVKDGTSGSRVRIREDLLVVGTYALTVHKDSDADSPAIGCAEIHVVED